ncbi:hypothetical protein BX264_3885 [Streptomyces sp. 2333.5]|nr:hypothetical protein BX264_3885 [Streptomyces sp. 2333.5]SED37452.1 hypothetical protein SAMN05428943_3499 [Streptomyces sp. 2314.4]SEE47949.1 hypothetical protein SAMN05428942_3988 [Streptomyces sp. 2112.2]
MGRHALRPTCLPDPDVVFRPTRRDINPATGELTAYALWDRHAWQPHGECWLWCGRDDVEVTWIGPVQSSGMHAAVFACRACLHELDQRVLQANMRRDSSALSTDLTPSPPAAGLPGGAEARQAAY